MCYTKPAKYRTTLYIPPLNNTIQLRSLNETTKLADHTHGYMQKSSSCLLDKGSDYGIGRKCTKKSYSSTVEKYKLKNLLREKGDNYFEKVESITTDLVVTRRVPQMQASLTMIHNVPQTQHPFFWVELRGSDTKPCKRNT